MSGIWFPFGANDTGPTEDDSGSGLRGPLFLGLSAELLLVGLVIMQCCVYASVYGRTDRMLNRLVVIALFLLNTARAGASIARNYQVFVLQGSYANLSTVSGTHIATMSLDFLIMLVVQAMFAYRAIIVSGQRVLLVPVIFLAIANYGLGIALTYAATVETQVQLQALELSYYWIAFIIDLALVVVLSWSFTILRSGLNPGHDSIMSQFLTLTLSNAALLVLSHLAICISIHATLNTLSTVPLAFEMIISAIASLCLLFWLNSRNRIRAIAEQKKTMTRLDGSPASFVSTRRSHGTVLRSPDDGLANVDLNLETGKITMKNYDEDEITMLPTL